MREKSRLLTLGQIRKAGACDHGRATFRRLWGTQALVNQAWAREAAAHMGMLDATWACDCLLPDGWGSISRLVRNEHRVWDARGDEEYWRSRHICWAIFAALYVEAGDA